MFMPSNSTIGLEFFKIKSGGEKKRNPKRKGKYYNKIYNFTIHKLKSEL